MDLQLLERFADQYKHSLGKWFDQKWQYINACIMESYLKLYKVTENTGHLGFVSDYVENLFNKKAEPIGLHLDQYNIDQIKIRYLLRKSISLLFTIFLIK